MWESLRCQPHHLIFIAWPVSPLKIKSCRDAMLSLVAPEFVFMTTYGAANNEKVGIMTTLFSNHTYHRICFTWMKKSHAALWDANLTSRYLLFDQCYHWKLRKSWYHNNSHGILNNEFILSLWRISGESLRCQPLGIHYQGCSLFLLWDLLYHCDDSLIWAYV